MQGKRTILKQFCFIQLGTSLWCLTLHCLSILSHTQMKRINDDNIINTKSQILFLCNVSFLSLLNTKPRNLRLGSLENVCYTEIKWCSMS